MSGAQALDNNPGQSLSNLVPLNHKQEASLNLEAEMKLFSTQPWEGGKPGQTQDPTRSVGCTSPVAFPKQLSI